MTNRTQLVEVCDFYSSVKKAYCNLCFGLLDPLLWGDGLEDMQLCGEEMRPSTNCHHHFLAT